MKKNLVLTGMMGVGKSTIGKKLAKRLKLKFVDIDQIIEKKEKNTIKEIFKNKSESYFRKIEQKITFKQLKKKNLVIALGGGAFINNSIRKNTAADTDSIHRLKQSTRFQPSVNPRSYVHSFGFRR